MQTCSSNKSSKLQSNGNVKLGLVKFSILYCKQKASQDFGSNWRWFLTFKSIFFGLFEFKGYQWHFFELVLTNVWYMTYPTTYLGIGTKSMQVYNSVFPPFCCWYLFQRSPHCCLQKAPFAIKSGVEREKNGEDLLFSLKDEKGLGYFYPGMVAKETEIIGRVMQGSN